MSIPKRLQPLASRWVTSQQLRALREGYHQLSHKISRKPHQILCFLRLGDPYSYLLLQLLPELQQRFNICLRPYLLDVIPPDISPTLDRIDHYARRDSLWLAKQYGLDYPEAPQPPCPQALLNQANQYLIQLQDDERFIEQALTLTHWIWQGQQDTLARFLATQPQLPAQDTQTRLHSNLQHLVRRGHYLSASLYYDGQWYWGVDRLFYLEQRLLKQQLNYKADDTAHYDRHLHFTLRPLKHRKSPLSFFFSFRSPYSYLALPQILALTDALHVPLLIKPILPMVMRGIPLNMAKRRYVLNDCKREAERLGIPFAPVCDPIGPGIEYCLAIYPYAEQAGHAHTYLQAISEGIWSQGADVSQHKVLAQLVRRAGLQWSEAQSYLKNRSWQTSVQQNHQELESLGLWGVPSFSYRNKALWGQDRIWLLHQFITMPSYYANDGAYSLLSNKPQPL